MVDLHDYGELKLREIVGAWEGIKDDRDVCWTLDLYLEQFKQIYKEFMATQCKPNRNQHVKSEGTEDTLTKT